MTAHPGSSSCRAESQPTAPRCDARTRGGAVFALPAYDAVARVKSGSHWQSDVLAGWALGTAFGYWSAKRNDPFFLQVPPHGITAGVRMSF